MAIQILPSDLFLLEIAPYLSLVDKISLYHTNKYFHKLFSNIYKTILEYTIKDLTTWALTPLTEYSYKEEPYDIYNRITTPICIIAPSLQPSFKAFYKLIYNMNYFNLLQLNNTVYRLEQPEIQNNPFAQFFTRLAITLYIQKFKNYIPIINNSDDQYAAIVYMNRVIPDEIKIRNLAAKQIDLSTVSDYTDVSTNLALSLVQIIIQANQPNYQYRHSYETQYERFQTLLKTIPSDTTDPFLSVVKTL